MTPVIHIILLNWNGKDDTLACLASLQKLTTTNMHVTIVVVDNGSTDDSTDAIRQAFPDVTLLETRENLGFAEGNNVGMRYAIDHKADYVWLLNNDTIVQKDALSALVDGASTHNAGIVGSKIYFAGGFEFHHDRYKKSERGNVLWYAGGTIDWQNMYATHRGVDEVDTGQYDTVEETPFVTGCSMFIRREVLEQIGLFDKEYFLYLEDVDLCVRAQHAGFSLVYAPASRVWHKNSGSTDRPGHALHDYYFTRNRIRIGTKFAPIRTKFALFREGVRFIVRGPSARRRGAIDAFLGRFGGRFTWQKNKA